LIRASCRRDGSALVANSAKAREKVQVCGISPRWIHPHSRRRGLVHLEPFDQQVRRRQLEDRLGDEGAGQGRPIRRRPSFRAVRIGQELLDAHELQNRHQFPVPFRQGADLFFKVRKEFGLDPPPCIE
jgi:hypothetical protein